MPRWLKEVSRDAIWRESNSRHLLIPPALNPCLSTTPSSDSYRKVYFLLWLRTRTFCVRFIQTLTISSISISAISHCFATVSRYIASWPIILYLRIAYKSLESRVEIKTQYVCSGIFHAAIRSHTRPRHLGKSRFAPRPGQYKTGTSVWQALTDSLTCLLYLEYDNLSHRYFVRLRTWLHF